MWLVSKSLTYCYYTLADEFKPHEDDGSGHDEDDDVSSGVDENEVTSDSASEPDTPVKVLLVNRTIGESSKLSKF